MCRQQSLRELHLQLHGRTVLLSLCYYPLPREPRAVATNPSSKPAIVAHIIMETDFGHDYAAH